MTQQDPQGFVLVDGLCYPLEAWLWALNWAVLEHLERRIPDGVSLRQAVAIIKAVKAAGAVMPVRRLALERMRGDGVEGMLPQAVLAGGGVVVGVIPVDKPSAPR